MEELPKRAEWRRIQREQERERRRIRDRQRRQSMTQEQRERHLARRRRNYQLRRQRADYRPLYDSVPQHAEGQERLNLESKNIDVQIGSSVHMEALLYTESNLPKRLRLNHIRHLARNLIRPIGVSTGNHQLEAELMAKGDVSVNGSRSNTVRLNRVKRLARSINTASKETLVPNLNGTEEEQNLQPEGTRSIGNDGQSV
ncbi:hypothetical protein L6164_032308 [Bauhinia variegata]|uniref:Uncharacterized protein n=1 Tax=Bauhinia variegata TaxID=167791 RepID=A0ACB9KNG6_BAUVA|nr:hypothetical protein L6164_032308 [Bauhinia variegata]